MSVFMKSKLYSGKVKVLQSVIEFDGYIVYFTEKIRRLIESSGVKNGDFANITYVLNSSGKVETIDTIAKIDNSYSIVAIVTDHKFAKKIFKQNGINAKELNKTFLSKFVVKSDLSSASADNGVEILNNSMRNEMELNKLYFVKADTEDVKEIEAENAILEGRNKQQKQILADFVEGFYIPQVIKNAIGVFENTLNRGSHLNVLVTGQSGLGKTSVFIALAKKFACNICIVDSSTNQTTTEWFGKWVLKDGNTIFEKKPLTHALENGNCIIVLDEINRVPAYLHNSLFPILDDRKQTEVEGYPIKVGNGVIFVLTANIGHEFTGTEQLDQALVNRVHMHVPLTFNKADVETAILQKCFPEIGLETTGTIIKFVFKVREAYDRAYKNGEVSGFGFDISTRTTLNIGKLVSLGLNVSDAIDYVIPANDETVKIVAEAKRVVL